jgi:hypothetical protein
MPAYIFIQDPTGGFYAPPALCVIVEADSFQEANAAAPSAGVYFDGPARGEDGARWARLEPIDDEHESVEAAIEEVEGLKRFHPGSTGPDYVVVEKPR